MTTAPGLALGWVFASLALVALPPAHGADAQANPQRISEAQLQLADRVLTGDAACEFNQIVNLSPIAGKPGHFRLAYKKLVYTVVPEETTSGALRLEDKKAGIVWLQIPSKSMLMNSRIGQRLVDGCMHPEQRAAVAAVEAAASAITRGERRP